MNMTQEQLVRELRSGLPIHTHPGDPEPRLSPLSVSCVHAIMSTAANVIETLATERDIAVKALIVTRDKVEQAHNMLIDDIVHRVNYDVYLTLTNMVNDMLSWPSENEEHSTHEEEP